MKICEINLKDTEKELKSVFESIEDIELSNQKKVIDAFRKNRVESRHFYPSTGYGYGDASREKLDEVFADVFGAENAFVRPHFASATHAITLALRALLKPNETILSITGSPYDTIATAIGINSDNENTLIKRGVQYKEISIKDDYTLDENVILNTIKTDKIKLVFIQRSRGYEWRKALSANEIG